jgi:hypothetical protein
MSKYNQKYSKELLEPIVKISSSIAEVLRKLGLRQSGGNHSYITSRVKFYKLDTSHFIDPKFNLKPGINKLPHCQILTNDRLKGRRDSAYLLRRALLESGIEHKCDVCNLPSIWNGKYLQLQIDHKNGDFVDNRIENLRFICGNCHTQTDTFGFKNSSSFSKKEKLTKPIKIKQPKPAEINHNWRNNPRPNSRKVERPSKEDLEKLLWEKPTAQLAIDFGVSDKAIEKWAKTYGITKPPRGHWMKLKTS